MHSINQYLERLNGALEAHFQNKNDAMADLARDSVLNGGKRLRGLLCMLSCEAVGGSLEAAIPVAVAYELYHAAALLQDDIIDDADRRRGKPSANRLYGVNTALLISDYLIFDVNEILAEVAVQLSPERSSALLKAFGHYAKLATIGEYLDIQMGRRPAVSVDDYVEMVTYKTSALLSAAAVAGAIVGNGSEADLELLRRYADNHGIAYQIHDDILDFTGDPAAIGKPVFNDLSGGKKNVVLVHLLREMQRRGDERTSAVDALLSGGAVATSERLRLLKLIDEYGSLKFARELAMSHVKSASEAQSKFKTFKAKQSFSCLSTYLATAY